MANLRRFILLLFYFFRAGSLQQSMSELVCYVVLLSYVLQHAITFSIELFIGVYWVGLFFCLTAMMGRVVTVGSFMQLAESSAFSYRIGFYAWREYLFALWVLQMLIMPVVMVICGSVCQIPLKMIGLLWLVWCVQSPCFLLLWYLSRAISIISKNASLLMGLLALPWFFPGMLLAMTVGRSLDDLNHLSDTVIGMLGWAGLLTLLLSSLVMCVSNRVYLRLRTGV
ncbi:MAG: hypothetical protein VYC40_02835 [Pseudomonadota bacterium]|nr:hypothetical protein [Pseudomonadota bacterium]